MDEKTILYVEDNFHNRRIVRKILGTRGYTILEAEDGLVGYEMICEIKPPLVLLDIALPHLDGMQIVQRLKADAETRHIPVVALTASAMRGDRERFLEAGCDDYLSKPVRAHELIEMVDKYFDKPSEPAAPVTRRKAADEEPVVEEAKVETAAAIEETPVEDSTIEEAAVEMVETAVEEAAVEMVETAVEVVEEATVEVEEPAAVAEVEEVADVEMEQPASVTEVAEVEVEEVEPMKVVAEVTEPVAEMVGEMAISPAVTKDEPASFDKILNDNVAGLFGEDVLVPATPKQSAVPEMDSPVAILNANGAGTTSVWVMDDNPSDARLMRRMIGAKLKVEALEVSPNFDESSLSHEAPALILFGTVRLTHSTYTTLHKIRAMELTANTPIFLLSAEELSDVEENRVSEYVELAWTKDKLMDSNFLSRIAEKLASIFSSADKKNGDKPVGEPDSSEPKASRNANVSVLVIEDIPDSAKLAQKILVNNNYGVHIADSGEAGLKMALEHKPKMILLDLGLPDVDGQTLLGVLRAEESLKDTPVIVCTAWPEDALKEIVASYGFDDYISKPYKVAEFMEVVDKYSA